MFKYKNIFWMLAIVSLLTCLSVYNYMTLSSEVKDGKQEVVSFPVLEKKISSDTLVYIIDSHEICQRHQLSCSNKDLLIGEKRDSLNKLTLKEIEKIYPQNVGWRISWEKDNVLIARFQPGICLDHQNRWHLEADDTGEKIAIYVGPPEVGKEGGLVRVTEIKIKNLPHELQERIRNNTVEFLNWEELIGTLDSLAEYMD